MNVNFLRTTRILPVLLAAFMLIAWKADNHFSQLPESSTSTDMNLHFRYDKRVETVYIVLMLSGDYDVLISRHPTDYKRSAAKYFADYKNHKAVQLTKAVIASGFSFDYAANWIFQFSDFPEFRKENKVDFPFSQRPINADTLEMFRKELVNFYRDANCEGFFTSQKRFLDEMISTTEASVKRKDLPKRIEDYYGIRKNATFSAVLSPLMHSGGYAIDMQNKSGGREMVALMGPHGEIQFMPVFDREFLEYDVVIHEIGHNYINPVVDSFYSQLKPYEDKLFPPVAEQLENGDGIDKASFLYELMVRAITVRIVANTYGETEANNLLDYEKSIGFSYVADVADELKNYERQRDQYKSIAAFIPEVVNRLGRIKE